MTKLIIGHPLIQKLQLFMALSRTPHGILDIATPSFAALLWLGGAPSTGIIIIGLITAFAGYTAVYALNDIVDYKNDKAKAELGGFETLSNDLDAILIRHPMARGLLSFKDGLIWALGWFIIAFIGAYLLNPICVIILLVGGGLEAIYCLMLRVSHLRVLVSGAVKTSGAVAAVFAVDPSPSMGFLVFLFLSFFFWEIGGQNIPNDWVDVNTDERLDAKTLPVVIGSFKASKLIIGSLGLAILFLILAVTVSQTVMTPMFYAVLLSIGYYFLILPAQKLSKSLSVKDAMALFNRASYLPLILFSVMVVRVC